MSFFNKKEDVIEIQLTQYGKHLLSKGEFKPTHYTFFDDDIIYDSQYSGFTEEQNSTESRIQQDTPRLGAQASFSGKDLEIFSTNPNIIFNIIYSNFHVVNYRSCI